MKIRTIKKAVSLLLAALLLTALCVPSLASGTGLSNFTRKLTYSNQYADLSASTPTWAYNAAVTCYETGLMQGTDGRFNGGDSLNVAQALVMADRVHQIYHTGANTLQNGTPWYQTYVDYAIENGIIKKGDFTDYGAPISRADMAYVFAAAVPAEALAEIKTVFSIPDLSSAPSRDRSAVERLYKAGVLTGSDEYGTFYPNREITRYEAAAIIARVAIESERKPAELLYKVSDSGVSFDLIQNGAFVADPVPSEDSKINNYYYFEHQGYWVRISVSEGQFTGSITDLFTTSEFQDVVLESADYPGTVATAQVSFGGVKAFRVAQKVNNGSERMTEVAYWFFLRGAMYAVIVDWYDDATVSDVQKTIDSIAVDGSRADARYVAS